jgi:hypothetical protein
MGQQDRVAERAHVDGCYSEAKHRVCRGGKGSDDGNGKLKTVVMEAAVAVVKRRLQLWLKVDRQ